MGFFKKIFGLEGSSNESTYSDKWVIEITVGSSVNYVDIDSGKYVSNPKKVRALPFETASKIASEAEQHVRSQGISDGSCKAVYLTTAISEYKMIKSRRY